MLDPLDTALILVNGGALLVASLGALRLRRNASRQRPDLELSSVERPREPLSITIAIAVRDEVESIEACVQGCLRQGVSQVLVYDDGSTDGTSQVLDALSQRAEDRLEVVHGEAEPPRGWTGKAHALHQLSRRATQPTLLFIDADVVLAEGAVATAMGYMQEHAIDAMSCLGERVSTSFWERVWEPMWPCLIGLALGPIDHASRTDHSFAMGGFIMIRRDAYDMIGGHVALRTAIVDGCALALRVNRSGLLYRLVRAPSFYRLRMYSGLGTLVRGWSKNAYPVLRYAGLGNPSLFGMLLALVLVGLGPWVTLALAWGRMDDATAYWSLVGFSALVPIIGIRVSTRSFPLYGFTFPFFVMVVVTVVLHSYAVVRLGRTTRWRSREYPLGHDEQALLGVHRQFIDRFMTLLDHPEAPERILVLAVLDGHLDETRFERALRSVYAEVPALYSRWAPERRRWEWASRFANVCNMTAASEPRRAAEVYWDDAASRPFAWPTDPPLRADIYRNAKYDALVVQLHHYVGDGRSYGTLSRRIFEHYTAFPQDPPHHPPTRAVRTFDIVRAFPLRALPGILSSSDRLSSARGISISAAGDPGRKPPVSVQLVASGVSARTGMTPRDLFYACTLGAMEALRPEGSGLVRLRVPVDLRRDLNADPSTIGNLTSCVPVEIPLERIRQHRADPQALADLLRTHLRRQLGRGSHWSNLIELGIGAFVLHDRLAELSLRGAFESPARATITITYVGDLTPLALVAAFSSISVRAPIHGLIGWEFQGALCISACSPILSFPLPQAIVQWLDDRFQIQCESR